jgi:hypothetical protein
MGARRRVMRWWVGAERREVDGSITRGGVRWVVARGRLQVSGLTDCAVLDVVCGVEEDDGKSKRKAKKRKDGMKLRHALPRL